MHRWFLALFIVGCSADTFTSDDAGDDAAVDASSDSASDAPSSFDAKTKDGQGVFGMDAGDAGNCVNGNLACARNTPCCLLTTSSSYGKCIPVGQCL